MIFVSLGFNGHFERPNLAEFRDTAPLKNGHFLCCSPKKQKTQKTSSQDTSS